jgi:sporulation protein YlmC with PRC-barrel domain
MTEASVAPFFARPRRQQPAAGRARSEPLSGMTFDGIHAVEIVTPDRCRATLLQDYASRPTPTTTTTKELLMEPEHPKTETDAAMNGQQLEESSSETDPNVAHLDFTEWHGKSLVDIDGVKIGKLQDVYFDVETDQAQFATVKEGGLLVGRHLTFVPLTDVTIGPDSLQVTVSKAQVKEAPSIELEDDALSQSDESTLYHHYQLNYTPSTTPSGRRLARR